MPYDHLTGREDIGSMEDSYSTHNQNTVHGLKSITAVTVKPLI